MGTSSGTSRPPARWAAAPGHLLKPALAALRTAGMPVLVGRSWTTDAPYRETPTAIGAARAAGAVCVEMEAAALYAYAGARRRDVICLAQVTNTMATTSGDFEKGHASSAPAALALATSLAAAIQASAGPAGRLSPAEHHRSPGGTKIRF